MNFVSWFSNDFFIRRKTLRLYRRGIARAKKHDRKGALANYTNAIKFPAVPTDVKAMALYNRALVYIAAGDDAKGVDDLDTVLAMDGAMVLVNIRTMARQKLARMESRVRKSKV
jgi:hypothetical protein